LSALFVIAREDRLDDALARGAAERGYEVARLALLATEQGPDCDRFQDWLRDPPPNAALAWTSRRAGEALAAVALPQQRAAIACLPLYAVGAESASPIRAAGFAVATPPDSRPGAKRLAALIARVKPAGPGAEPPAPGTAAVARVAFLHGDRSLPDLPEALAEAGIEVEPFELYGTRFLSADVAALERAAEAGRVAAVAFFSPSGVEALERLLRPEISTLLRSDVPALARGETTRAALESRGYRRGSCPSAAESFDSFALEALQSAMRTMR
jgi:uroporphyrinogen-III synthase